MVDIYGALKLNVIQDEETEASRSPEPAMGKPVRIRQEPIPIPPREPSTRIRRQNTMLRDYELGAELMHEPRPLRLTIKIPKKVLNEAADRYIVIPDPEAGPPRLSLIILKKICKKLNPPLMSSIPKMYSCINHFNCRE